MSLNQASLAEEVRRQRQQRDQQQQGQPNQNMPTVNNMQSRGVTVNTLPPGFTPQQAFRQQDQRSMESFQLQQRLQKNRGVPSGYAINDNGLLVKQFTPARAPQQGMTAQTGNLAGMSIGRRDVNEAPVVVQTPKFATNEDVTGGQALWTDQSVSDREAMLADPNFYKNNQITKYSPEIQQQILADPNFQWDKLPNLKVAGIDTGINWQQAYFNASSRPAVMGAIQGGIMGGGNPGGAVLGAALGAAAGWGGYDQNKEWWQQGDKKLTWDKQQVKDTVNAGMGLMNWAAEQAEKTIGTAAQAANAAVDPNKNVADLFKDKQTTKATWNAGASFFEVIAPAIQARMQEGKGRLDWNDAKRLLPTLFYGDVLLDIVRNPEQYKGEEIYLGASMPAELEKTWVERLDQARNEIKNGRNEREVMSEMQTGIMAQIGDMAGQGIADPLNVLPKAETTIGAKVAEATGHNVAAEAFKLSESPLEAAKTYKTLVQTGQAMTIDPKFKVDQMGAFSRFIAGINSNGAVRAGSLIPSNMGLLDSVKNKTGFLENMTSQTPHSRAQTGAGMFYENIGAMLTMFDTPEDAGKYLNAIAKGDNETWSALGSKFADSPEFYTILPALKDFATEKLQGITQAWEISATNRDMLTTLSNILGEEPARLLDDLAKNGTAQQDYARIVERLRQSTDPQAKGMLADIEAGKFTADTLKQTVDVFTGDGALPWHPAQWKAQMLDTLGTHFDEWVTKRLMLDKSPEATSAFFRTTALMKQAQSILLLGGSPGYAITNGLSNMVHRAATGIYGYLTPNQINSFMDRMGVAPARLEEGVGIGGQVEMAAGKSGVVTSAMDEAMKGKGALTNAKNALGKLSKGMPFSKLSSWFEASESKQAFAIGMKQFWSESWRRGVGFSKMTPELTQAINALGVKPDRIYAAIEAGMNQGEIERALFGRFEGVQARSLVNDAAQKTGMSAGQAATMLDQIGILDVLDNHLKGRTDADGVRAAFQKARKQAQDWADMQTGEDLKAIAESVKQKVGLEGATTALDVAQKANAAFTDTWLDHYARFGEVMNDLQLLDDPAQRSKAIELNYQQSDEEFRRVYARHAANYQGIFEAWGMSQNPDAIKMLAAIGDVDTSMSGAYTQMREIRRGFFDKWRDDFDNPARWDEWDANNNKIDALFKKAFKDKHAAEVRQGEALAGIYEKMYSPAAGEAARQWFEEVTRFNDEIVQRERDFRNSLEGMTKDQRDIAKQEYYSKDKVGMIVEADRINGEGIARLERVIKKGGGTSNEGQGGSPQSPNPSPAPLSASQTSPQIESNLGGEVTPDQQSARTIASAEAKKKQQQLDRVEEFNAMMKAAEQRKAEEAKGAADRMKSVWDVAESYAREGLAYDRTILQDKFALMNALRKTEYGGVEDLSGLSDPRLTPELVKEILDRRQAVKEQAAVQQVESAVIRADQAAANAKAPRINENTTILKAISELGGLQLGMAKDITGEARPKTAPGVFTRKGRGIDEIARLLTDEGYPIDLNDPNDIGGVAQTTALINRARTGDKVYPVAHDYEASLAKAQTEAAVRAFDDSFDFQNIDMLKWQDDFTAATQGGDLNRMYELIGDFPEELNKTLAPSGEEWDAYMSRMADETAAKVEESTLYQKAAENATRAEQAIAQQQTRAEAVTTRQLMREKFQEAFKLNDQQADAYMELSDSLAGWVSRQTGENPDEFYTRYYADVERADSGDTNPIEGLKQSYNRIEVAERTMTPADAENYARMLVRGGEGELRNAIRNEANKADRIAILDEAHKLDAKMAEGVARGEMDILFQEAQLDMFAPVGARQLDLFSKIEEVKQEAATAPQQPELVEAPKVDTAPQQQELLKVQTTPNTTGKLTDFGEKLGGARKDKAAVQMVEYSDGDIARMKLSEIFPKSIVDNIEDVSLAAMTQAIRDSIPTKPRDSWKLKRWVEQVKQVQGLIKVANEKGVGAVLSGARARVGLEGFVSKTELLSQLPREKWGRVGEVRYYPEAYTYKDGQKVAKPYAVAEVDGKTIHTTNFDELTSAVLEKLGGEVKPATATMKFEVRVGRDGKMFINKAGDPLYRRLKEFDNEKEAFAFIKENRADLVQAWEGVKESDNVKETDVRRAENAPRTGKDYRKGKEATPEMFMDSFGFRGVEFGNWVSQGGNMKERQGMLNAAYDALMDLADITNIPPKAISLDGTLGLGLGSRGSGNAAAHYETDNIVINLTKTRGAGSLAHEWFHALDNYFQRKRGAAVGREGSYITYQPETYYQSPKGERLSETRFNYLKEKNGIRNPADWAKVEGVRPEMAEAFTKLVKALDDSPMAKRAALIDKGKGDGYWSRVIERAARSFENYTIFKMAQEGYQNDYLANVAGIEEFSRDPGRYPYLLENEMQPVVEAFSGLFDTAKTNERGALYQTSGTAKGMVKFGADGIKASITAFESADFTTLVHENGHVFRRVLEDVAERTGNMQIKHDLRTVEEWAGVKDGSWDRAAEEKFARGFENYVTTGKAPLPKLNKAFEMIRTWMLDVYKAITGSAIDVKVSDDVRRVFDRMLGADNLKVDLNSLMEGMGYDPKEYYIGDYGDILKRGDLEIKVDAEKSQQTAAAIDTERLRQLGKKMKSGEKVSHVVKPGEQPAPSALTQVEIPKMSFEDYAYSKYGQPFGMSKEEYTKPKIMKALMENDALLAEYAQYRNPNVRAAVEAEITRKGGTPYEGQVEKLMQPVTRAQADQYRAAYESRPDQTMNKLQRMKAGMYEAPKVDTLFQEADQQHGSYDAASQFQPQSEVMDQGWAQSVEPLLKNMEEAAINQLGEKPLDGASRDIGPEGQKALRQYMKKVQGEMATTKLATIRHAEQKRDFAMLNYSKRYGFDRVAETVYPYQFYQTRTMVNWAMRALDKPAIFSNYARLHNQQNRYERDIPERLRGKIKINAPWLPDWMGDGLYIDPIGSLFPPASLLKPFDRMTQQHTYQQIEAERILQEWTADGKYSEADIIKAAQTRSGTIYERAFAEAQQRRESEVNNPVDFMNTMFGPAWYLTTPYKLASGKANEVTSTPLANTARAIDTVTQGTWAQPVGDLIGLIGKPEEMLKKKLGIPEFGEYGDYYIDRQIANMVAEGKIDSEQAQIAMIERQGDIFTEAEERVKMELALRVPTAGALYAGLNKGAMAGAAAALPSLFGASLLPAGELEYRGLKEEWNEAWKRRDAGDKEAINNFFEMHPEYEAYLAKGKEPEERLKSFLIGQIWDGYMELGTTNKKEASAQMGEMFKQSFLDKETRSYETLDIDTLTQWAQMLGQMTPKAPSKTPPLAPPLRGEGNKPTTPKLDLYDPAITQVTDKFFEDRTRLFPNYYETQQGYYNLATKGEKARYLAEHPDLKKYWDWKDGWYEAYPEYKPIFGGQVFKQVDTSGWPPMLEDYVRTYAFTGGKLPSGASKALEQVWINEGMPMGDFKSWLTSEVVPGMMYGK